MRDKPYDLYLVMGASALLVLVILLIPETSVLRIILGLPFLLFFPGYTLISALYPEKPRIIVDEKRDEDLEGDDEGPEEGSGGERKKGLDGLERTALSLGLSIAITPLIGLILNYTYDWDPEHLGIRLYPILFSQFLFILATSVAAIHRRNKTPVEDRFEIVVDLEMPEDYTPADKALTVGIVIMMLLSVGLLVYIIVVPREGEAFTEFYVLGGGGMADDYPRYLHVGERSKIFLGVGNHEHEDMNYSLVLSIDPAAENITVHDLDSINISSSQQSLLEVGVESGDTIEIPCNFSIAERGAFKLRFLLFLDGELYRDLHLWVSVFDEGEYLISGDAGVECFVSGPNLDPTAFASVISEGGYSNLTVGVINRGTVGANVEITFSIGTASDPAPLAGDPPSGLITPEKAGYHPIHVQPQRSVITAFNLYLPAGHWELEITIRGDGWTMSLVRDIIVEGG